jgi:hypothetical protein
MSKKYNQYLGKAGQLIVMAELLARGWNVAIPEVDVGDDIFVVKDEAGLLMRVQVKTATATIRKKGFSAQFQVNIDNLAEIRGEEIHYAFMVRMENSWAKPVIMSQTILFDYVENRKMGSKYQQDVVLYFTYQNEKTACSNIDLSAHIEDFSSFPIIPL